MKLRERLNTCRCGKPFMTMKERMLRTCNSCARSAAEVFQEMAKNPIKGFKKGFNDVVNIYTGNPKEQEVIKEKMSKAMQTKEKKILKKLEKEKKKLIDEGFDPEEVEEHFKDKIDLFKKELKNE